MSYDNFVNEAQASCEYQYCNCPFCLEAKSNECAVKKEICKVHEVVKILNARGVARIIGCAVCITSVNRVRKECESFIKVCYKVAVEYCDCCGRKRLACAEGETFIKDIENDCEFSLKLVGEAKARICCCCEKLEVKFCLKFCS